MDEKNKEKNKTIDFSLNGKSIENRNSNKKFKYFKTNSKRKINIIINSDTIVYDIIGGNENKNRLYEKISLEITNLENKNLIEKSKLEKKIKQISVRISDKELNKINENEKNDKYELIQNRFNLQNKKLIMLELERDKQLNYIDVINRLKIPPEKRRIRDVLRIKTYIEQSNFGKSFNEEFSDINIVEKLKNFCGIEMRYEKFNQGKIIYKIGDPPNSFYSIIFGKVKLLKPIEKHQLLTGYQYFSYLMNLRKQKEYYIFHECIKNNTENYHVEQKDEDIIHYIYLLNYLEFINNKINTQLELDKILDLIDVKPEELGIDPAKINSFTYMINNMKMIRKKIPSINEIIKQKYSFINNYFIKKKVITYEYKAFESLFGNDYFGNFDIENHTIRHATAIAEDDTEVAYLSNKLYSSQIASLKQIVLENKMSNLHSSFFFNKIKYSKFAKKYYKLFINEKYNKGDILFNEEEKIKYLYFIQEGNAEIYTSKSMNEIQRLLQLLIEKKSDNKGKRNENDFIYSQLKSENKDFINYLNEKKTNKLLILNNNEDIGAVSYFLGDCYLASCKIISNFAKIVKINVDYVAIMLKKEYDCNEEFQKRMNKKLELLSERLFKINNIKLIMTDDKIKSEELEENPNEEKEKNLLTSPKNKILIDYEKISSLINNNSINNIKIKLKNENNLNLPKLSMSSRNNVNYSFLNTNSNEINEQNIIPKSIRKKKPLNIEDNIIKRINKDIKYFRENKFTLSKESIKLNKNINRNDSIKEYKDKNNKIFLTNSPNNNSKSVEKEKEIKNNSNNNTIATSSIINERLDKSSGIPKILYKVNYDIRSYSNDYKQLNSITIFGEKINRIIKKKEKKYNHPYYDANTLIKNQKYKIFDFSFKNKEIQDEFFKSQIKRIRNLKNIHINMKAKPKFINNINNSFKS